uniref:Uncharacterized protein n=1 Tax=Oryza punctata TaxID=4537 RepID=A0A0E0JJ71_ORYPU
MAPHTLPLDHMLPSRATLIFLVDTTGHLTKLRGRVEVTRCTDHLEFSVGIASTDFTVDNFLESPQCGCGFDCDDGDGDGISSSSLPPPLEPSLLRSRGHLFDGMQQREVAFSQIALAATLLGGRCNDLFRQDCQVARMMTVITWSGCPARGRHWVVAVRLRGTAAYDLVSLSTPFLYGHGTQLVST